MSLVGQDFVVQRLLPPGSDMEQLWPALSGAHARHLVLLQCHWLGRGEWCWGCCHPALTWTTCCQRCQVGKPCGVRPYYLVYMLLQCRWLGRGVWCWVCCPPALTYTTCCPRYQVSMLDNSWFWLQCLGLGRGEWCFGCCYLALTWMTCCLRCQVRMEAI
jgi:hypothetical protein